MSAHTSNEVVEILKPDAAIDSSTGEIIWQAKPKREPLLRFSEEGISVRVPSYEVFCKRTGFVSIVGASVCWYADYLAGAALCTGVAVGAYSSLVIPKIVKQIME